MSVVKTDISDDRIRVAYLSGDFHEHPVAILTVGLFELHDRGTSTTARNNLKLTLKRLS